MTVGMLILALCNHYGFTQKDLAEKANMNDSVLLNEIIKGKRTLQPYAAKLIGEALDIDPLVLLTCQSVYLLKTEKIHGNCKRAKKED